MPLRIQFSRRRGWRMPANTIKVDRSTPWGNPFRIGRDGDAFQCVQLYDHLLDGQLCSTDKVSIEAQRRAQLINRNIEDFRGHNLACWCRLCEVHRKKGKAFAIHCSACAPCHCDVIGRRANGPISKAVHPA